jgi:DNA-binding GntR family transcriptional regulator
MTLRHVAKIATLAIAITLGCAGTARAQVSEEDRQFMNEIAEAMNSANDEETTREAHGRCVDLSKRLAARSNVDPLQRLYFEAMIEHCISSAMYNGQFSDATGDACSHHFTYATKLSEVIREGNGKSGFAGELMQEMGHQLQRATEIGPQLGCKGDYEAFRPAIDIAKAAAALPASEPDFALWQQIVDTQSAITDQTARDGQKACLSFAAKIAEKLGRPVAERAFLEAQIANCISVAMEKGKYSDETGDLCVHHHRYASKLFEAVQASKDDRAYAAMLGPIIAEELKLALEQGPAMGCKQDYGALKAE